MRSAFCQYEHTVGYTIPWETLVCLQSYPPESQGVHLIPSCAIERNELVRGGVVDLMSGGGDDLCDVYRRGSQCHSQRNMVLCCAERL